MRFTQTHFRGYRLTLAILISGLFFAAVTHTYRSAAQSNCLADPGGLVAWYPFQNDGSDKTGIHQAILSGNPSFSAGKVSNALQLDGSGTYAKVFAASTLNVGTAPGFTVEGWIKPSDLSGAHAIASWNGYYSNAGGDVVFFTNGDRLGVIIDHVEGGEDAVATDPGVILLNTWQHVALTYDKASGVETLYVNGQPRKVNNAGSFTAFTSPDFYIGRNRPSIANDFAGAIDELSIYNRGLSAAEVASLYTADSGGKCAPTPTPTPECTSLPSGAAASYALDANGTDRTGANNATISGVSSFSAGKAGNALQFDGTTTFAKANASASLDAGAGSGLTIEAWIKANNVTGYQILAHWDKEPEGAGGVQFDLFNNHLLVNLVDTNSTNHLIQSSLFNPDITPNIWNHVALTYDKASGVATLYSDGQVRGSSNLGTFTPLTTGDLYIGKTGNQNQTPNQAPDFFNGAMDEFSVYNRALTAAEIQAIYSADSAGKCAPTPSPTPTPTPTPSITLNFNGKMRDRVSQNSNADAGSDGQPDGTFTVTLPANGNRTLKGLVLQGPNGNTWDTTAGNSIWVAGVADQLDSPNLLNNSNGDINGLQVGNTFKIFVSDIQPNPTTFSAGANFTLTITFSDNSTATGSTSITKAPAADIGIVNLHATPNPIAEGKATIVAIPVQNKSSDVMATGITITHAMTAYEFYDGYGVVGDSPGTTGTCTPNARVSPSSIACTVSNLKPGEGATVTLNLRFQNAKAANAGQVGFNVNMNPTDASPADNTANMMVSINAPNAPSNDNVAGAVQLNGFSGTLDQQNNVGATRQQNICTHNCNLAEPLHADKSGGKSVWFFWVAPANGDAHLFTNVNDFDTLLAVYSQSNDGLSLIDIASNDDADPTVSRSDLHFTAHKDQLYLVAVDGYNGASGNFALGWTLTQATPPAAPMKINAMCSGNKPDCNPIAHPADNAVLCTADSDSTIPFCTQQVDAGGFRLLTVKGENFTSSSLVLINDKPLEGFLDAQRTQSINGATDFIDSNTLIAHVPPFPQLTQKDLLTVKVVRFVSSATASREANFIQPESLSPGKYELATNVGLLNVIQLKNAVIPVGETRTVCGDLSPFGLNKPLGETCIEFNNKAEFYADPSKAAPVTITPSWFAINAYCQQANPNNASAYFQCTGLGTGPDRLNQLLNSGVSINPGAIAGGQMKITTTVFDVSKLIGNDGGGIVAQGGGNIVAQGGGNIVATGGGNIVATGGGNIVATGGGNIVATGGGNIVAQGGGNIVAQGGGNIVATGGGNIVATGGGNRAQTDLSDIFSGHTLSTSAFPQMIASSDLQSGSKGWFVTKSSGGQQPTVTTTNNLDGTVTATISMTFDMNSNPRITDLQGLTFNPIGKSPIVGLASTAVNADEAAGHADVIVTRAGDTSTQVTVGYATSDGTATLFRDYTPVFGSVTFAAGETQKTVTIPLIDNGYAGGSKSFNLMIGNPIGAAVQTPNVATITINNNDAANLTVNPLDNSDQRFFIRQQYLDFLSRQPDQSGWDFWANTITSCGSDAGCIEAKRINGSAAFFLSIEFQDTGFMVYRMYKAAYGNLPNAPVPVRFNELLPDAQEIGSDVVVGRTGWETSLENNKQTFAAEFINRPRFMTAFPLAMSPTQFVDTLNANAGSPLTPAERNQLISDLTNGVRTRDQVLRAIAENQNLTTAEFNRAFVLMQYFGYLRRDPNSGPDADFGGYNFWLNKLNSFNGDYLKAEMVKAFLNSVEYRQRFAP